MPSLRDRFQHSLFSLILRRTAIAAAALLGLAIAPIADRSIAAPQPDPIPQSWQLDVEPGPLRLTVVNLPDKGPRPYFYLTYYVENNTGQDRLFAPSFELATAEEGSIIPAGRGVSTKVTQEILRRLENPFLEDQLGMVGVLQQGEINAKEGLVVWPAENLHVDQIRIFAAGFSGETKRYTRPDTGEQVILRKTLLLRHEAPGVLIGWGDDPIPRVEQRWIMR